MNSVQSSSSAEGQFNSENDFFRIIEFRALYYTKRTAGMTSDVISLKTDGNTRPLATNICRSIIQCTQWPLQLQFYLSKLEFRFASQHSRWGSVPAKVTQVVTFNVVFFKTVVRLLIITKQNSVPTPSLLMRLI